jgi:hypothetical protein
MENPFEGVVKIVKPPKEKKKKQKKIMRGGIVCTCGELNKVFTSLYYLHKEDCVINIIRNKGGSNVI